MRALGLWSPWSLLIVVAAHRSQMVLLVLSTKGQRGFCQVLRFPPQGLVGLGALRQLFPLQESWHLSRMFFPCSPTTQCHLPRWGGSLFLHQTPICFPGQRELSSGHLAPPKPNPNSTDLHSSFTNSIPHPPHP